MKNIRRIKLLEDIPDGYGGYFRIGEIISEHEPYSGFNADGSFTICYGQNEYVDVQPHQFEELI